MRSVPLKKYTTADRARSRNADESARHSAVRNAAKRLGCSFKPMPHVVIHGPVSLEKFYQQFEPTTIRENSLIMKTREAFLNVTKDILLLECVAVEDRFSQIFYMQLVQKAPDSTTVRLDALTDPEKNDAVRRFLAIIGAQLKAQHPACQYAQHNLSGFLCNGDVPI